MDDHDHRPANSEFDVVVARDYEDDDRPYKHIEWWTDGEWVRIGRDVTGLQPRCIEMSFEAYQEFLDRIRGGHGVFKEGYDMPGMGRSATYIVDLDRTANVYRGREHVLYDADHEHAVFWSPMGAASERRREFEPEKIARNQIEEMENVYESLHDVSIDVRGSKATVEVIDRNGSSVSFALIDEVEERFGDDGPYREANVYYDDEDEDGMVYQFSFDTSKVVGGDDDV